MKRPEHIEEAKAIGADSWVLLAYEGLPKSATPEQQIEALQRDDHWQENHRTEISHRISDLIQSIEAYNE